MTEPLGQGWGWDTWDGDGARDGTPRTGTETLCPRTPSLGRGTGPRRQGQDTWDGDRREGTPQAGRGGSAHPVPPPQEYLAVTSVELIVRASVSVTSSIKNLVLKDASTQVRSPLLSPPTPAPHPAAP